MLALTPVASHAAPKKTTRTVEFAFEGFCGVRVPNPGGSGTLRACVSGKSYWTVQALKSELYMSFSAKDDSGTPVGLSVFPYNGSDFACGSGKRQTNLGGAEFTFMVTLSPADCQGVPTRGTITAVLSNLP